MLKCIHKSIAPARPAIGYGAPVRNKLAGLIAWLLAAMLTLSAASAPAHEQATPLPGGDASTPILPTAPHDGASAWPLPASDIITDPDYIFGRLDNGLRYAIRANATPAGTALVRMEIGSGSLAERNGEQGYAHFVEHMAFNGSTHVPEGEMVRLLEREGLAFGADTNATTSYEQTQYRLDLPRNDPALLNTALMLMREAASELTFSPDAVERERGVILSEMRDRDTYALRNYVAATQFFQKGAFYVNRLPIGTRDALMAATSERLRAFWLREYVPANATVIIVGDFEPAMMEAAIRHHFASWAAQPTPPQPDPGPLKLARKGKAEIYLDPALSERVTAARLGPWLDEPDNIATRQRNILRLIGYNIINRRLQRQARSEDPPFRGAGFGTGTVFRVGRTTRLIVDTGDGEWETGLNAAIATYRKALAQGFTQAEVAEQLAIISNSLENTTSSAETRSHQVLLADILALLRDDIIPGHPMDSLTRFNAFTPQITPERVLAAMAEEAVALNRPLLRFEGRRAPDGGKRALRKAWDAAIASSLAADENKADESVFAYDSFGADGAIIADTREEQLGIRLIRFANGVRLNLKPTTLQQENIRVTLHLDGGQLLNTKDNPLATAMTSMLPVGGLGKHTQDELQSLMAGHTVGLSIDDGADRFTMKAQTTPRDLELQLKLFAAALTDPGYRSLGEIRYRRNIANFFASKDATPSSALGWALGAILSDDDPRFSLQAEKTYQSLSFAKLREDIGDRLAHGAIELSITGDFKEEETIALVARTLGALSVREADFQDYADNRNRSFTANRAPRIVHHKGQANQALLRMVWQTTDDHDPQEVLKLGLLAQVLRNELLENLREALGKAYSPGASSSPSRIYRDYGTFQISASIDLADIPETRAAIAETLNSLRTAPIDADALLRARQPMLESYDNALKSNAGWANLTETAQSRPERIERFIKAKQRLAAITAQDLQATARHYLGPDAAVEILTLHESVADIP